MTYIRISKPKHYLLVLLVLFSNACSNLPKNNRSLSSYDEVQEALHSSLTREALDEVLKVSQKIQKNCPPDKCIIIGVGRSPTPFITHFKNESVKVKDLPLSSFRYNLYQNPLNELDEKLLFKHFSKVLGDLAEFDGKRILLVDYAQTGASLFATQQYLSKFFKKKLSNLSITSLAITTASHSKDEIHEEGNIHKIAKQYKISKYKVLQVDVGGDLSYLLDEQFFDDYAEFRSIEKYHWGKKLVKNPDYKKFKKFLKNTINTNESCSNSLRNLIE